MTYYDVKIEIRALETNAPEYYLKALMCHIKLMIEMELNNAPDIVVESFDKVDMTGTVKE